MRTPPLLADFTHPRACKPICEKSLTLPLLAAKANVDRLLNMEMAYDMEKEKGHDQR